MDLSVQNLPTGRTWQSSVSWTGINSWCSGAGVAQGTHSNHSSFPDLSVPATTVLFGDGFECAALAAPPGQALKCQVQTKPCLSVWLLQNPEDVALHTAAPEQPQPFESPPGGTSGTISLAKQCLAGVEEERDIKQWILGLSEEKHQQ